MMDDLRQEATKATGRADVLEAINRERECSEFTEWRQGRSPKEHQDMIDTERLRDWQRKVEQEDRAYRDEQRQKDLDREENWRREERTYRDDQNRATRRQFWLTLIIGMILIPLVAALMQSVSTWLATNQSQSVAPSATSHPINKSPNK